MKRFKFTINGNKYEVDIKDFNNNIAELEVNGTPFRVEVDHQQTLTKTPKMVRPAAKAPAAAPVMPVSTASQPVISPLPGTILKIIVKEGDKVVKGDKLLIMEAMKMENDIQSEKDGIIRNIWVTAGENVLQGAVLMEIE